VGYASFEEPDPICPGDTATMTINVGGGVGPWDVTFTDGINSWTIEGITETPYAFQLIPSPATEGDYQYWITSVTTFTGVVNNDPSPPVTLTVLPKPDTSPIYRYDPQAKK
jgi:hypothetical protein